MHASVNINSSNSFVNGIKNSETMTLNNLLLCLFMIFISITSFNVRSIFADETTTAPTTTTTTEPGNNNFSSLFPFNQIQSLVKPSLEKKRNDMESIWDE